MKFFVLLLLITLPLCADFSEYEEFEEYEEFHTVDFTETIITPFPKENLIAAQENREELIALVNAISEEFFAHNDIKLPECSELDQYVKKGGTAIDYGAGNGVWTVVLSDLVGRDGKVVAFESHPQLFKEMFWNLVLNHIQNAQLFCAEKSLDALKLENVSVIRINADGREDDFFKGASKTIQNQKPILIVKMLGGIPLEWADRFVREEYDNRIDQIHRMGYTTQQIASGDYLALPK